MNKRSIYSIVAAVILVGIYFFNIYLDDQAQQQVVETGKTIKVNTNTFFLPTSTTGDVVHHDNYSFSYHEKF